MIYEKVLDYWNGKKIVVNKKFVQGFIPMLNKALKQYSAEEIKIAIDRYAVMFHDPEYAYCKYKWSLPRFLYNNRFAAFLDNGNKWLHYCEFKKRQVYKSDSVNQNQMDFKMVNYYEYLKSEHWQQFRKAALKHRDYACQECNAKNVVLTVHHKNYDCLWEETFEDVLVLCRPCHTQLHCKKGDYVSSINAIYR